jgi:hypothetical protein
MRSTTTIGLAIATASVLSAAVLGSAAPVLADPPTASGADVVIQHLKDEGYNVIINMPSEMALSRCTVSGINGLTVTMAPDGNLMAMMGSKPNGGNVSVDLNCPDSNN